MAIRIPSTYGAIFRKTERTIALHSLIAEQHKTFDARFGSRYSSAYEDQYLFAFNIGMGPTDAELAIKEYEQSGFVLGEDFWISGSGVIRASDVVARNSNKIALEIRWLKQQGKYVYYMERSPRYQSNEAALSTVSRFLFGSTRFNKPLIPVEELFLMWGCAAPSQHLRP